MFRHSILKLLAVLLCVPLAQAAALSVSPTTITLEDNGSIILSNPSKLPTTFLILHKKIIQVNPDHGIIAPGEIIPIALQKSKEVNTIIDILITSGDITLVVTAYIKTQKSKENNRNYIYITITCTLLAVSIIFIGSKIYKPSKDTGM